MGKDTRGISAGVALGLLALAIFAIRSQAAQAAQEYPCPYCGEVFTSLSALQSHVQQAHPGERIPISIQWG